MPKIADIPFFEVEFDKTGALKRDVNLPAGFTDLFVISHGWNNDAKAARELYTKFFTSFAKVARDQFDLGAMKPAILGVFWPSKEFGEDLAVSGGSGSDAAAVGGAGEGVAKVKKKLDEMKKLFSSKEEKKTLDEAKKLVPKLQREATARRQFVKKIRSLLDPAAASKEDASHAFFDNDEDEVMEALQIHPTASRADADDDPGIGAVRVKPPKRLDEVVAAGNFLTGFFNSALNVLNFTTYYEMKTRAGTVGANGLAKILDRIAPSVKAIHLIGHSFGGRVVTAAAAAANPAANATDKKLKSLTLLQAAFSHNGFSKSMNGFFRKVIDEKKISGPILITHSDKDKAVGVAYPLASKLNRDDRMALGDANDRFGGIGRNGAQKTEEAVPVTMLNATGSYQFTAGKLFNLNGNQIITGHGDVHREPCAFALLSAVAKPKP
jgi:hypothetical protein